MPSKVTIAAGVRFRSPIADANVLWEVTGPEGPTSWSAVVVDEPIDLGDGRVMRGEYAGTRDVFTTDAIARAVTFANAWAGLVRESRRGWDQVPLGSTVHYCDGHNRWVRGRVEERDGVRGMVAVALVGDGWREHEVVTRARTGEEFVGYRAREVLEGRFSSPTWSTMAESDQRDASADPSALPARDLTLPEPTDAQRRAIEVEQVLAAVCAVAQDYTLDPVERRAQIRELVG